MNMGKHQNDEHYRFEYKFTVPKTYIAKYMFNQHFFRNFTIHHPSQYVNNLYFDDLMYS
jgi:hypothetical protein